MKKFVFFDRDGTLIEHVHHLVDHKQVILKPDLVPSLSRLFAHGFSLGLVTNQSVISLGLATIGDVWKINNLIEEELQKNGIFFELIKICPHKREDECACRKPKIGLLNELVQSNHIDLTHSFMVGDQSSDVEFGRNLGVKTAQITLLTEQVNQADFLGGSLTAVVNWILEEDDQNCMR